MLDLTPEPPRTREGRSGRVQLSSDKEETKLKDRLGEAIARLLLECGGFGVGVNRQSHWSPEPASPVIAHDPQPGEAPRAAKNQP